MAIPQPGRNARSASAPNLTPADVNRLVREFFRNHAISGRENGNQTPADFFISQPGLFAIGVQPPKQAVKIFPGENVNLPWRGHRRG